MVELLHFFLAHRADLVERIQGLLNAQRKPAEYLRDAPLLSHQFENCFFSLPGVTPTQARLLDQLEETHRASGFSPRDLPGLHNGLIDPAEMMLRSFHLWQQTRWPGHNGRVRYAHTLFNLYLLRCLELLSMRIWDGGDRSPSERLSELQRLLDQLWSSSPPDQPVLVRDARWLIPLAQSPATDDLGAYFTVAEQIAGSLSDEDGRAIARAGVRMAAGHLRSQIRYYSVKNAVTLDDARVLRNTRGSNALDFALLIQDLVPLLDAYTDACTSGDATARLELADTICQGVSPDPELFLTRVELLGAYSMIEPLFVTTDAEGNAVYTPMGQRHVRLFERYQALVDRAAAWLLEDCPHFRPAPGSWSPFGVLFGFSTDLLEHMAFRTLMPETETRFGLEDVFTGGGAEKLAWVTGWRKLPHLPPDVIRQFDYPQQFAEDVHARIERALRTRVGTAGPAVRTGRLVVLPEHVPQGPEAIRAESHGDAQLLSDRREGRSLLSYRTPAGGVALSKAILTDVLGAGRDAHIAGLPPDAASVLRLLCPGLV